MFAPDLCTPVMIFYGIAVCVLVIVIGICVVRAVSFAYHSRKLEDDSRSAEKE